MSFLTDRTLATSLTLDDLVHIVITGDTSQNPAGSSYKATLGQIIDLFSGGTDTFITGGTYSNGTLILTNNTGGTINISGFYTGSTDVFVTGGTYNNNTGTATFTNNTGGTFNVTGFYTGSTDVFVTGGTYNNNTGTATFTNNTGGTFNVTGFYTGETTTPSASFYDTGDQTGLAGVVLTISASTADTWNYGITLSADTKFVIQDPGVYNMVFSAQMVKIGGNSATHAHIWLSQNGTTIPYSAGQIGFPSNSVYIVPSWNYFFETINPNEYVELKWEISSNVDNQLFIKHQNQTGNIPGVPSIIITFNKVN